MVIRFLCYVLMINYTFDVCWFNLFMGHIFGCLRLTLGMFPLLFLFVLLVGFFVFLLIFLRFRVLHPLSSFRLQLLSLFFLFFFFGLGCLLPFFLLFFHSLEHDLGRDSLVEGPFLFPFINDILFGECSPVFGRVANNFFDDLNSAFVFLFLIFKNFDDIGIIFENDCLKEDYIWLFDVFRSEQSEFGEAHEVVAFIVP